MPVHLCKLNKFNKRTKSFKNICFDNLYQKQTADIVISNVKYNAVQNESRKRHNQDSCLAIYLLLVIQIYILG